MEETVESILLKVREETFDVKVVEKYRDTLIRLKTKIKRREAELKKQKALFLFKNKELSVAQRKINWDAMPEGLELIQVHSDLTSLPDEIDSLQSRIYSLIR